MSFFDMRARRDALAKKKSSDSSTKDNIPWVEK